MATVGVVVALITVGLALYALYWARKGEIVQLEDGNQHLWADQGGVVAGDEAAATGDEVTEIGPAAGIDGGAIPHREQDKSEEDASLGEREEEQLREKIRMVKAWLDHNRG